MRPTPLVSVRFRADTASRIANRCKADARYCDTRLNSDINGQLGAGIGDLRRSRSRGRPATNAGGRRSEPDHWVPLGRCVELWSLVGGVGHPPEPGSVAGPGPQFLRESWRNLSWSLPRVAPTRASREMPRARLSKVAASIEQSGRCVSLSSSLICSPPRPSAAGSRFSNHLVTTMSGQPELAARLTANRVSGLTRSRVQISPPPPVDKVKRSS